MFTVITAILGALANDPVSLEWTAPEGCPSEGEVHGEALRLLDGPPIDPERRVMAVARVSRTATGRWRVDVTISSASGQGSRSLEAETCSGLADATALIVAITVDPDRAGAAASAPPPRPSPSPSPSPSPAPSPSPLAAPVRSEAPRLGWAASASGVFDVGTLPGAAVGIAFGAAGVLGHLRSDVALSVFPDRTYASTNASGAGAEMSLWTAAGSVAYLIDVTRSKIAFGGGAEVTHVNAVGVAEAGPFVALPRAVTWLTLRAGAALTTPILAPVYLRLELAALAPLARPAFRIDPVGVVHRPSALAGRLAAGVEVHF